MKQVCFLYAEPLKTETSDIKNSLPKRKHFISNIMNKHNLHSVKQEEKNHTSLKVTSNKSILVPLKYTVVDAKI